MMRRLSCHSCHSCRPHHGYYWPCLLLWAALSLGGAAFRVLAADLAGAELPAADELSIRKQPARISAPAPQGVTSVLLPASINNRASVQQHGSAHVAWLDQSGADNQLDLRQSGQANWATLIQLGQNNLASVVQGGSANTARLEQKGDANFARIEQYGTGGSATIIQYGSGNSASTIQY